MTSGPDHEQLLMERYRRKRDQEALGQLFTPYMELVYGVCLKYLGDPENARDAVMDIYEHISIKLPSHRVDKFSAWLYMVSKNHCLQLLRKKNRLNTVPIDDPGVQKGPDLHQESEDFELHIAPDEEDLLHECIGKLPDYQQACIRLFYFEKRSYAEISAATALTLEQVRSGIQNGRRNLKKCLETRKELGSRTDI